MVFFFLGFKTLVSKPTEGPVSHGNTLGEERHEREKGEQGQGEFAMSLVVFESTPLCLEGRSSPTRPPLQWSELQLSTPKLRIIVERGA